MSHHINIVRIKSVYNALGELRDSVAFVGGATVSLYADNPANADVRPTNDIDVLIEIASYNEYVKIQQKLAELQFEIDTTFKVICRYKHHGLTVDIMPIDEHILGFSNKWYKKGFAHAEKYRIDEVHSVSIFPPAYFVASKLEAFKGRGESDGRTSQDFEDIVFVLDNRKSIWDELNNTEPDLKAYLKNEWKRLIDNPRLEEWLSVHLEPTTSVARARLIRTALELQIDL